MTNCLFCKIITGEIPSTQIYQDELVTAFRDINPSAPTHVLIIPNKHIPSVNDITDSDELVMGRLFSAAKQISVIEGINESGYRLIMNTGPDGHQEVFHIHLHLLGGQSMKHPMG